jgi:hypothetical protein
MRVVTVAAALLLVGCPRKPPVLPTVDFVVYGDCRHNDKVHREIVANILSTHPKFVAVTGDLVDEPDLEENWAAFRATTRDLRAQAPYFSAVGDHDYLNAGETLLKELNQEGWFFDRQLGDIHFFFLDSRSRFTDAAQIAWLEKTARASTAKHKMAVFHHPPFQVDPKRAPEAEEVRATIHPLLVRLKFCAVFCGHQHAFYSTVRDGIRYVVTAGGGAPLRTLDPSLGLKTDLARKFYHFCGFTRTGSKIEGRVFDRDGVEDQELRFTLCDH